MDFPHLHSKQMLFLEAKASVLKQWVSYPEALDILRRHRIEPGLFSSEYGSGVFDYFMAVASEEQALGDCPAIARLLAYFEDHDITADELFLLCRHFHRAMINEAYRIGINDKILFEEMSRLFDQNFAGVLKRYTDTIYQKEREIERNVKLLEDYRRAIDESAMVAKTDINGIITYANANLSRVCGFEQAKLIGSPHSIMRHPEMSDAFFTQLWATIGRGEIFKGTIRNRSRQGSDFHIDTTIVPITDTEGVIQEYMAISYEITDLVIAKEEAIRAGEAKAYFLSNMSHEIRTPLNAILGFVALLKEETPGSKHRRYLDIIHNSGENLLSIINDILDFSKLRSGEFTVEARTFNLHRAVTHTLELFVPSVNQHHLTLTSFIDPRIPYELISDPLRIQQVISNLLSNAIKFTPPFGEIRVEASFEKNSITVSVTDTGIGIAPKDLEHIFDPFSQVSDDEERLYGGTGLGLSISAQLVNHMGGKIHVDSRPGLGSTFAFTLPVEVGGDRCPSLMNTEHLARLNLALLVTGDAPDAMSSSLLRYLESFGVPLHIVREPDESYDLLFFSTHFIEERLRDRIFSDTRPAIALMERQDERYESYGGAVALVMPLYCSKLQEVMEQALLPKPQSTVMPPEGVGPRYTGKVLVAEDNEANQELIRTLLGNVGIEPVVVSNGAEALEAARQEAYDLILMDEQMPVMSGPMATRSLRKLEAEGLKASTPIVAITANVIVSNARREEYDDFLGKPVRMEQLHEVLDRYLERTEVQCFAHEAHFDPERLCAILQLSREQLGTLMGVYLKKMDEYLPQIEMACARKEWKEVARLAHAVKGSGSNFRFEAIREHAERMESAARHGDPYECPHLYAVLRRIHDEICQEAEAYRTEEGALSF